jgi:hypothetical protein
LGWPRRPQDGRIFRNLYDETSHDPMMFTPKERSILPTAVAMSPSEDVAIRRLAERDHTVVRWTEFEFERGGHVLALEAPGSLAADVRAFFAEVG